MDKETKQKQSFSENKRNAIALILTDLREQKGLTQKEVARQLYVANSTISHYESGISLPSIEMIDKLSDFYEVSADYLLNKCVSKINYSKQLDKKLTKEMSIGRAVEIMLNANTTEKQIISGVLQLIEKQNK